MTKNLARRLGRWLLLPPALFALACALLAPAEAGRAPGDAPMRRATQEGQEGQARQKREPEANTTVRGRVVYDDTSRPVRRARIMLMGESGARSEYGALTDGRGEFQIRGVRAGTYFTFVDVPGVVSPVTFISVDEMNVGVPGMPDLGSGRAFFDVIEVDGKEDLNVTVRARRGASIAGRVTYADGDPAVNVTVSLMRRVAGGRLQRFMTGANLVSMSGFRTDDRGMYRLTGLPPGDYVVGVSEPVSHSPDIRHQARAEDISNVFEGMMGQQLLMTFHPSTASAKEAAVVKLAAGDERTDVDVRIAERELRTVSGVVRTRRDKRPLARARVTITRRDDPLGSAEAINFFGSDEAARNATTTDEEGRWQFNEIPDGPYTINVKPAQEYEPGATAVNRNSNVSVEGVTAYAGNMNGNYRPPRRKPGLAPARRDVEVSGGDLPDVLIETGEGGRISGRITVEGGDSKFSAHVATLRLPDGGGGFTMSDYHSADVGSGEFTIDGLPAGRFDIQPSLYESEANAYLKSITWNGKDLLREPLVLAEGASAEGVQVVFARNPATLRLTAVRADDRKPSLYSFAFLLPADAPDASIYSSQRPSCSISEEGFCLLKAPPGDYVVVVLPRKVLRESLEAEVKRRAAAAPRVTLRAGETKELEVVVPDK
ncbi:MAG TPA: carboxypeptidase-like regulatory domain-containing protein [Pyrinomonadaceae bacterium]